MSDIEMDEEEKIPDPFYPDPSPVIEDDPCSYCGKPFTTEEISDGHK
jgi:hypothetical protein